MNITAFCNLFSGWRIKCIPLSTVVGKQACISPVSASVLTLSYSILCSNLTMMYLGCLLPVPAHSPLCCVNTNKNKIPPLKVKTRQVRAELMLGRVDGAMWGKFLLWHPFSDVSYDFILLWHIISIRSPLLGDPRHHSQKYDLWLFMKLSGE